jgi:potassium-transporting ATPase KdpC subunit
VGPDIEAWFQQDKYQGTPHIVAQWADLHNSVAHAWVTAHLSHSQYVDSWAQTHASEVAAWIKDHPDTPQPKATDFAVPFSESFSQEYLGRFPSAVTQKRADGTTHTTIAPVTEGADIQATFFDMWRQDPPEADLQDVPGDMVTASGSGLDPHITLENATYQLDRVASAWATDTKHDPATVRKEIEQILQANAAAPLGGIAGEKLNNVLQVNLELRKRYGAPR